MNQYKDLRPRKRYVCNGFWCTLLKKGYHPKAGVHTPQISVLEHSAYQLEAELRSGKLQLSGYSYPVLGWTYVHCIHDDIYDSIRCVYDLVLGMGGIPIPKAKSNVVRVEDEHGVAAARVKNCYRIAGVLCRLLKKNIDDGRGWHEPIISVRDYHQYLIKSELNSGTIDFNHMLYLVLDWEIVPQKAAIKKDGTPYYHSTIMMKIRLKTPGRKIVYDHQRPKSKIDNLLANV